MKTIKINRKLIEPHEILYLESEGNYTIFHLVNNRKLISSFTLQIFEKYLREYNFFRINRSHVVNFSEVEILNSGNNQISVLLKNGLSFLVSRRRRRLFNN